MVTIINVCGKESKAICTEGIYGYHRCIKAEGHPAYVEGGDCVCKCGIYFKPATNQKP